MILEKASVTGFGASNHQNQCIVSLRVALLGVWRQTVLICWLIGWPCAIAGSLMVYMVVEKVTIPYNKIVFERTNEYGVMDLEKWNDAVNFKKKEVKKEFFEAAIGGPGVILFVVGSILVGFSTINHLKV